MKGLVLINAYWRAECVTEQAERIQRELELAGVETDIKRNGFLPCAAGAGIENRIADAYDFCVYLDKDKYVSELLEKSGMRLFNRHEAVRVCDDKMRTYAALAANGIAVPYTVPAPLCYTAGSVPRADVLDEVERRLGYPIVIKTSYGSGGKGVYKADNRAELERVAGGLLMQPHMYQQYIESDGKDIRVIVIGGRVTGGMLRTAPEGEFRSNIAAGGSGQPYPLDDDAIKRCERVADVFSLDYAGIDLLRTPHGYIVCEVNSNAFFAEFERTCGINVAGAYAGHIVRTMSGV